MALPVLPDPCPTLKMGRALGAPDHTGFVAVWNWIVGVFKKARDYFVLSINGRTGCVDIVAGSGINVSTSGKTITISLGDGETSDDGDNGNTGGGSGEGGDGVAESGGGDAECDISDIADVKTGGGGGGGGVAVTGGMFAWTPPADGETTGTIGAGGCMVGRKWVTAFGTGSGKAVNKLYSLMITLGSSPTVQVVDNVSISESPSGDVSYIPIYRIGRDGKISTDYRGAFVVPAYE